MIAAAILQRVGTRLQDFGMFAESCARRTNFQKSYPAGPVENGSMAGQLAATKTVISW
jgi:hypothetical protein